MVSKELLSEVFEQEIRFIKYVANNTYEVHFEKPIRLKYIIINIYELAHKCKEWANKQGYWANSGYDNKYYCMLKDMPDNQWFYADTEVEAIFKACQWILDSKEGI